MTTLKSIDLTCPNCELQFSSKAVELEPRGRKHTDFRVETDGVQTLAYGVHLCERCGFAGLESWFSGGGTVSYEVRRHVWDELAPKLTGDTPSGSEKYEFAAKVATWDGVVPRQIGDLWLRAAWCCVDEGDTEAERYYRRQAAWSFQEALETYDGVDVQERAVLTYLVGELWRRIGDSRRANEWFEAVPDEIVDPVTQGWIARYAELQRHAAREWFA